MAETPISFEGFKITKWYKYLLYLFGIILVLTLFFDVKGIEVSTLRQLSINTISLGIFLWIVEDFANLIGKIVYDRDDDRAYLAVKAIYLLISLFAFFYWAESFSL